MGWRGGEKRSRVGSFLGSFLGSFRGFWVLGLDEPQEAQVVSAFADEACALGGDPFQELPAAGEFARGAGVEFIGCGLEVGVAAGFLVVEGFADVAKLGAEEVGFGVVPAFVAPLGIGDGDGEVAFEGGVRA